MTNEQHDRDATVDRLLANALARGAAESPEGCLDAGTLAAWADNALSARDLAAVQAHAADCARCQAMLAAMVKSAPAPPVSAASPWRAPSLRWLIPPAAAAAAVVLWIVVPSREMGSTNVRQVSQSAESIPASAAAPEAPDAVALSAARAPGSTARRAPETPVEERNFEVDKKVPASREADGISGALARSADARVESARDAEAAAAAGAHAAAPAAGAPPLASAAKAFSFGAAEIVIVSSNPASRWRLLRGGAVQRSADGGATWETQDTGVSDALLAGASPSPSVCWLVGPRGIVLLTTDGRSWTRLAFPQAVSLVAVKASDDQTATVTGADGRSFITEDGGRTWTRAP